MDIDRLFIFGVAGLMLYMMIFQTDKWKTINEEGWRNMDRLGRSGAKATKFGIGVLKLFRR
jgi:hypothetical protein